MTYSRDNKDKLQTSEGKTVGDYRYNYMTDDEVAVYNYLLARDGGDFAQEYLDFLEEDLNYRVGAEMGENIRSIKNTTGRAAVTGLYALGSGAERWGSDVKQFFSKEQLPTSPTQYASQYIRNDLADTGPEVLGRSLGQLGYDAANTVGYMAPSIAVSKFAGALGAPTALAQGVGATTMGVASAGSAYQQVLAQGHSQESARTYSLLVGAAEGGLQYLLGGIKPFGGAASEQVLKKISSLDNALLRVSLSGAVRIGSEVTEEELQLALEPVLRSLILKEDFSAPTFEDAAYTAILTALTTGTLNAGGDVGSNSSLTNQMTTSTNTYRADQPRNVDLPTVPIINLSMQSVADLNGGTIPDTGDGLRDAAISRARTRLGLDKRSEAYIPASNVLRNGEEYILKITPSSIKKMLHPSNGGSIAPESIVVLDNIERIANNGVYFRSEGDRQARDQIAGYDHLKNTVYIDNRPYLVDMRVRLLKQTRNDKIDNVLYYYTPDEIVSIKKVDTDLPTDKRHALDMSRETASTYFMVPHSAQSVNEQKLHIAPPQKSELTQEGYRLLKSGQMVSDELLSAMGVTQRQAKSIVNAARTNTSTPVPTTSKADYTPYLEQLKQAQRDRKVRDLQNAYQKFVESEQKTAGTVKSVEQSAPASDTETEFKKVLETAASGGKIELSEEMEKYIANKSFAEIEGLREKLSDRAARRWYKTQNEMILSKIDTSASLEAQAHQACSLRIQNRVNTRDLMEDVQKRQELDRDEPNTTFDELLARKMNMKGLTHEEALKDIIATAGKTRQSVNNELGLE